MPQITEQVLASTRRLVALRLWELGAVKVNLEQPFQLVSGNFSPIYINCRQVISSPTFMEMFAAAAKMVCAAARIEFDLIAGGETAGIPFAAFLSSACSQPMIYVRKQTKSHGIANLVEGVLPSGARVMLVEDLITDAGSKVQFIDGIKAAGGVVNDVLVLFDRLQGGAEALSALGIRLHSITDMSMVLEVAEAEGILSSAEFSAVREYFGSPADWHKQKGLAFKQ